MISIIILLLAYYIFQKFNFLKKLKLKIMIFFTLNLLFKIHEKLDKIIGNRIGSNIADRNITIMIYFILFLFFINSFHH